MRATESGSCAPLVLELEATLNIAVAPGGALGSVDFTGEAEVQVSPQILLADVLGSGLACQGSSAPGARGR